MMPGEDDTHTTCFGVMGNTMLFSLFCFVCLKFFQISVFAV